MEQSNADKNGSETNGSTQLSTLKTPTLARFADRR